ncbi:MAG: SAM-dependent methyltransferase, partial [Clostridiales bacterium]
GLRQVGLEPVRLRMVQSFAESEANLFLVEAKKNCRAELKILPPLIIYRQRDIYSEEMQKIYQGR